jgi:hypothetical protein
MAANDIAVLRQIVSQAASAAMGASLEMGSTINP